MNKELTPVVPFDRPDSQNRIIVPRFLVTRADRYNSGLITTKLRGDVAGKALHFLGIIDPNSECGEDALSRLGYLLEVRSIDERHRIIIPSRLVADSDLSFLRDSEVPAAMSLLPDESGVIAGREDDIVAFQRLLD